MTSLRAIFTATVWNEVGKRMVNVDYVVEVDTTKIPITILQRARRNKSQKVKIAQGAITINVIS